MDGHKGIKNESVKQFDIGAFQLVLTALDEGHSAFEFIIHASSNSLSSSGLQSLDFLRRLGYSHYRGGCPFYHERCFWFHLATVRRAPFADTMAVMRVHDAFERHAKALPEVYELYRKIINLLIMGMADADKLDLFPELRRTTAPVLECSQDALPDWVAAELPPRFVELTKEIENLKEDSSKLRSIGGLLWQTGESLNCSVKDAFDALGYRASLTPKGKTYDVTVEMGDGRRLLIEATGISGSLKKDSNKIGQALQACQQEAQPGDRVVIAVNAHRELPIGGRGTLEVVTNTALPLITGLQVNVITTATVFNIWRQSLSDMQGARSRMDSLHSQGGGLFV